MPQQFTQNIEVLSSASVVTVRLDADNFSKPLPNPLPGGGSLALADPNGKYTVSLHARDASFSAGGNGHKGVATLRNGTGEVTVALGGADAGELHLRNQNSNVTVTLRAEDNKVAGLWMGGGG